MNEIAQPIQLLIKNIERVIVGKTEVIRMIVCSWLAGGHVLIEDVPGTGKTMLARALAKSVSTDFKRIQFTPDLLPSDILGTSIYRPQTAQFEFQPGPIFTTILLADEINRATPRTQSALLEAMAESQVSFDRRTHALTPMFFVIATQNPIEHHGTFPLPEAQLDRFMMRVSLGYPTPRDEIHIVKNQGSMHPIQGISSVITLELIHRIRQGLSQIKVSEEVYL